MIGRLLVGPEIGRGGYAVVRQALEPDQRRQLAWKELLEEKARQAHLVTAHQAEAWILSSTSHPSIPHVYAYLRDHHAFVMDFIPGISLDRLLDGWVRTPLEVRSRLVTELVGAVVEIHRRGFLHLDLKLANLLLTPHGNLYLVDFGVAALHWMNTHAGTRFPLPISAAYAAPEMVARRPVYDHRADVYSLAVVLYAILTGQRPYRIEQMDIDGTREAMAQIHARGIPPLCQADARIPPAVEQAVLAGMRPDPEDRPQTAMAFGKRVVQSLRDVGMATPGVMEAWAAGQLSLGEKSGGFPLPWDGTCPLMEVSLDEEELGVAEPVLVTRIERLDIEPATVTPGEEVLVTWRPALPGEEYELAVLAPDDLRPRVSSTRSCPHRLRLDRPGRHRLHVRAVNAGLRGAWSPEATVEVVRPGLGPGALAAIGGAVLMVVLTAGGVLVLGGRGGQGRKSFATPTPLVVAFVTSPTPREPASDMPKVAYSWTAPVLATRTPVSTATPRPARTPTPTRTVRSTMRWEMESSPPKIAGSLPEAEGTTGVISPLAGRRVRIISAGKGGLKLRAINDLRGLMRSNEVVDGGYLRLGANEVRLHVESEGVGREVVKQFQLGNGDLQHLKAGGVVQKRLEGGDEWRLMLKVTS